MQEHPDEIARITSQMPPGEVCEQCEHEPDVPKPASPDALGVVAIAGVQTNESKPTQPAADEAAEAPTEAGATTPAPRRRRRPMGSAFLSRGREERRAREGAKALERANALNVAAEQRTVEAPTPEALAWAKQELGSIKDKLQPYSPILGDLDAERMLARQGGTINRLHAAKLALDDANIVTPAGERLGGDMRLVAIPWQAFKDASAEVSGFHSLVKRMRGAMGMPMVSDGRGAQWLVKDSVDSELWDRSTPMYLLPEAPGGPYTLIEYLDYRTKTDGPWGLGLMQVSKEAGFKVRGEQSGAAISEPQPRPAETSSSGPAPVADTAILGVQPPISVNGQRVDGMGIFEWLALTFQEGNQIPALWPARLPAMLVVGHTPHGNYAQWPCASWQDPRKRETIPIYPPKIGLESADLTGTASRPRLPSPPRLAVL